jgi:hypothetical protein
VLDPIDVFDSCRINPSTGDLAEIPVAEVFGITYLMRYKVSTAFLLSDLLLKNVLGVALPRPVVPRPTITG